MARACPRRHLAEIVFHAIAEVAPDVDATTIDPENWLHEEAGLDSLDFLHLIETLARSTGIEIPAADYTKCATLEQLIDYLDGRRETSELS